MSTWEISKEFACSYGHRVWSQKLEHTEYTIDSKCVCRHLHGHQMKLLVHLKSNELKEGMVVDFKYLNWMKKLIDDVIDHKFLIDRKDPLFDRLVGEPPPANRLSTPIYSYDKAHDYWTIIPAYYAGKAEEVQELLEGFVVVNFVPTSENICRWLFNIAKEKMEKIGVTVSKVEFWETPKSHCEYVG